MKMILLLILFLTMACSTSEQTNKKAEIYYSHGSSKLMTKEYTEALELLQKAEQLHPNDSKVHNNLGMAYYFKNRFDMAKIHLNKAIKLDSKNSDAKNNLASILYHENNLTEAKRLYLEIQKDLIYKNQYRVNYNLALIAIREGNIIQAINYLTQAIAERDDYCPAHFKLGELAERHQNLKKAYIHYQDASKGTCVNLPASHYKQAELLLKMNELDKAQEKLFQIRDQFSTSPYSHMASLRLKEIEQLKMRQGRENSFSKAEILNRYRNKKETYKNSTF